MTSAFAAAGYDLQAFDASDMAYGTDRLLNDVMTATGPSIASNLYTTENEALLARSTSWSRNRISNGMNTIVEEAGKKIGFAGLDRQFRPDERTDRCGPGAGGFRTGCCFAGPGG